jgi:hypothetical protein
MFAVIRLVVLLAVIVVFAGGALLFVSRATCRSTVEKGKTETRWSLSLPGAKPDAGCRNQQTGLSYLLDQVGLKS